MTDSPPARSEEVSAKHVKDATDLARGVMVSVLGIVGKASRVLFLLFAAHFYGKTVLGLYFLSWSTAEVVAKISRFGLDRSLIRELSSRGISPRSLVLFHVSLGAGLGIGVMLGLVALADPIAVHVFNQPELAGLIRLASLTIPVLTILEVFLAAIRAFKIMRFDAYIRGGVEPFVLLGLAGALYPLGWGAETLILAQTGAFVAAAVAAVIALRRVFKRNATHEHRQLHRADCGRIVKFSWPLAAVDTLTFLGYKTDLFLVGVFLQPAMVGVYGVVVELISLIKRARQAFEPILAPLTAQLVHANDRKRLVRSYGLATRWLLICTLPLVATFACFGREALLLFDVEGSAAWITLAVLALGHGLCSITYPAESLLVMSGRSRTMALIASISVLILAGSCFLLVPQLGIRGAAYAVASSYAFLGITLVLSVYYTVRVHPAGRNLILPILAAAGSTLPVAVLLYCVSWESAGRAVLFVIMIGTYLGLLATGKLEPEERAIQTQVGSFLRRHRRRLEERKQHSP